MPDGGIDIGLTRESSKSMMGKISRDNLDMQLVA